ncbi:RDD family protein [bacterium BMS3Bbin06]|nr:RDD family protein [bacterium BMS3Abin08]GBE35445.1 RDD family protein [bacterium BMS3Bbin06]HDO35203.1 hypothetical protein [Nitrospirota bacterium]HDY71438.1 hypothetical protein [Nitrospirota bacterium]
MATPAGILSRIVAKVIDLVFIAIAIEALNRAGFLAAMVYILVADGLFEGRSPGKMLVNIQTVKEDGTPCTLKESIIRNTTFAVGLLLWKIPIIGWALFLILLSIEFVVLIGSGNKRRVGDVLARTDVVEFHPKRTVT